jgi:tRNA A37 threonylcarbamoyladenosine synthetase subunit TsaC/SUA5/YrdC
LELVDIDEDTKKLFLLLTDHFWPGPLTVILKANHKISPKITADTGYVGIRHPNHKTA